MKKKNKNIPISFVSLDELIEKEQSLEAEGDEFCYGYPDEVELNFNDDVYTNYDPEIHEDE